MFTVPFAVLVTWPLPNYVNPVVRQPVQHWLPSAIFLFLSTTCIIARLWHRIRVRHWVDFDDLFVVMAWFFSLSVTSLVAWGIKDNGWDRHLWDLRPERFQASLKSLYFARIFWGLASCFVRFSVICLFYRLIKLINAPRHFWWIMHATLLFNIGIMCCYLFTGIFPCSPIRGYWQWPPIEAKCINDGASMEAAGVLNTFAEFQLATLPIIALRTRIVNIDKKQYWNIVMILSLGFLITIVGCIRTYYIYQAIGTHDLTWYSGPQWVCAEVELDLAVVCASAAPLRAMMARSMRFFKQTHKRPPARPQGKELTTSTMSTNITISQIHHKADMEHATGWADLMRTIDLEGMPDDGLGYTVTITGALPLPRHTRNENPWHHDFSMNLLHPRKVRTTLQRVSSARPRARTDDGVNDSSKRLNIPVTLEVAVEEKQRHTTSRGWQNQHISPLETIHFDENEDDGKDNDDDISGGRRRNRSPGTAIKRKASNSSIVNIDAALDGFEFSDFSRHLQTLPGESPIPLGPGSGSRGGAARKGSLKPDGQVWTVES